MVALSVIFDSLGSLERSIAQKPVLAGERNCAAVALGETLRADFDEAIATLVERGSRAADRRALVRCFGSVIEGLANALRTIAETVCAREGRRPAWQEKSPDSCGTALNRICVSYRVISRSLPGSPLFRIESRRFDQLSACLDIRNRVVHPETPADLEITEGNIRLLVEVARQFIHDFETLARWQARRQEGKLKVARSRRKNHRGGRRLRKCDCGSGRKRKNCCGRTTLAVAGTVAVSPNKHSLATGRL